MYAALRKIKEKATNVAPLRNFLDDRIIQRELRKGEYAPIRPHPRILDFGAHKGYASGWFAAQFPGVEIHSYEPNPALFSTLKRRMRKYPHVKVFNEAVAATEGWADLHVSSRNWSSSLCDIGNSENVRVKMTTLKCATDRLGGDDILLKIDIEGAEFDVLKDVPSAITEIVGEVHPEKAGRDVEELRANLQVGFALVMVPSRKGIFRACR